MLKIPEGIPKAKVWSSWISGYLNNKVHDIWRRASLTKVWITTSYFGPTHLIPLLHSFNLKTTRSTFHGCLTIFIHFLLMCQTILSLYKFEAVNSLQWMPLTIWTCVLAIPYLLRCLAYLWSLQLFFCPSSLNVGSEAWILHFNWTRRHLHFVDNKVVGLSISNATQIS